MSCCQPFVKFISKIFAFTHEELNHKNTAIDMRIHVLAALYARSPEPDRVKTQTTPT